MSDVVNFGERERRLEAERLALQILEALSTDARRLAEFLEETGLNPDTLRKVARGKLFYLGLVDWVLRDTDRLAWFCGSTGAQIAAVERAQRVLAPPSAAPAPSQKRSSRADFPPLPPRRLYR